MSSDNKTPAQRSYNMSRIRSRNTSPERAVRNALWHSKAPIKYVVTFTNLKFRLVTPYRSLVIDQ